MNRWIIRGLIVLCIASLSSLAQAVPGGTYTIHTASGDVSVVCTGDPTVDAIEVNSNNPATFAWSPLCTSVESGFTVTWAVPSPAIRAHDPASELDAGVCFHANSASGIGRNIVPGVSFTTQLKYEVGIGVSARTVYGGGVFGAWHLCPGAIDLQQTTLAEAVIPYRCEIHPNMQGLVVVEAAGSVG